MLAGDWMESGMDMGGFGSVILEWEPDRVQTQSILSASTGKRFEVQCAHSTHSTCSTVCTQYTQHTQYSVHTVHTAHTVQCAHSTHITYSTYSKYNINCAVH